MRSWLMCAALATATAYGGSQLARAADNEAGVPLSPAEAGGVWTLEADGHDVCAVTLGGQDHAASADKPCAGAFDGAPAGWRPTADGMELLGSDGKPLIAFGRWSNSLLVSHRSSGIDIQLRRGAGPVNAPG